MRALRTSMLIAFAVSVSITSQFIAADDTAPSPALFRINIAETPRGQWTYIANHQVTLSKDGVLAVESVPQKNVEFSGSKTTFDLRIREVRSTPKAIWAISESNHLYLLNIRSIIQKRSWFGRSPKSILFEHELRLATGGSEPFAAEQPSEENRIVDTITLRPGYRAVPTREVYLLASGKGVDIGRIGNDRGSTYTRLVVTAQANCEPLLSE